MKIVLIGAGSAAFTQGLIADFIQAPALGKIELSLVDTNENTLHAIVSIARRMVEEKNANIAITAAVDRRELLPGADVVVSTVAVGGRRAWENDVLIPRKYGIYQPVGDTTMPGGISRALRMIPVMLDIARDVAAYCPSAYFFNYANPMTAICAAIRRETDVQVVGLCHGINHVEHHLAQIVGAPPGSLKSIGAGINHLTFLTHLTLDGANAWPLVDEALRQSKQATEKRAGNFNMFSEAGTYIAQRPCIADNPFSWSLYETYGAFPAVLDRHVTEFFSERFSQGQYYKHVLGKDAFSFEATIAYGDRSYEEMHEQAAGRLPLHDYLYDRSEGEHEQLVEIIRSLAKDERKVFFVNIPNQGAVPNLPSNAVLEMPAAATGAGFLPLFVGPLPKPIAAVLQRRLSVVELTVEAALLGDRRLFIEALLADGAVKDEDTANKLAEELLYAQRDYLPQFKRN